jgi:hypothetical protein
VYPYNGSAVIIPGDTAVIRAPPRMRKALAQVELRVNDLADQARRHDLLHRGRQPRLLGLPRAKTLVMAPLDRGARHMSI